MSTVMDTDGMQHHQMFECLLNSFPASLCCSAGANINCLAAGLQGNLGSKQFPWSELLELDTIVISLTRCYQASI